VRVAATARDLIELRLAIVRDTRSNGSRERAGDGCAVNLFNGSHTSSEHHIRNDTSTLAHALAEVLDKNQPVAPA
jgi:hypothetical protein